jgi:tetratricopeptide (TPR) repeat protein
MHWRIVVLSFALLTLSGCAFQSAIESGHQLVAQQHYRAALAEYERALRLDPDSDDARRLVAQITPYAIEEAEVDMRRELGEGRYERALEHADYVSRLDPARGAKQRQVVRDLMRTDLEGRLAGGQMASAYPLAVRAARLFPDMPGLGGIFERLRQHYEREAELLAAKGDYEQALAALDVIEQHEPDQAPRLAPRRAQIRGQWADSVAAKAQSAEAAEELGAAAALYARAYEIAGRAVEGDAMRRLVRQLREEGSFVLAMDYSGDPRRRKRVAGLTAPRLADIEGVVVADAEGVSMRAAVSAGAASCSEDVTTSTASQDYVAGTREVANPEHQRLSAELAAAQSRLSVLTSQVAAKSAEVARKEQRADDCHRHASHPRPDGSPAESCASLDAEASQARSELAALEGELAGAQSDVASLGAQRAATSPTLTEDIIQTFHYQVAHHERRCGMSLSVALEPAWSGPEQHALHGGGATSDSSHQGYPEYGVASDPLVYPVADGTLIGQAEQAVAADLAALVAGKVRAYYRAMADRALRLEAEDGVAAADMMVAIISAGGGHLDDKRRAALGGRLRARFGLESLATLRK